MKVSMNDDESLFLKAFIVSRLIQIDITFSWTCWNFSIPIESTIKEASPKKYSVLAIALHKT